MVELNILNVAAMLNLTGAPLAEEMFTEKVKELKYVSFGKRNEFFITAKEFEEVGDMVQEAIEAYDNTEELECSYLESTNEHVLNVGNHIICDEMTQEQAEGLYNKFI